MKILEISRSFYPSLGGLEIFLENRLRIFNALGHTCDVLTTDYSTGKLSDRKVSNKVTRLSQAGKFSIVKNVKNHLADDYDLISVNQLNNHLSYSAINYYRDRNKIILTPHMSFHAQKNSIIKFLYSRFVIPNLLKKITAIITFTEYEKEFWINKYRFPKEKLFVIPQYIDPPVPGINSKNADEYILYLGRAAPNKRLDLLVRAFQENEQLPFKLYLSVKKEELNFRIDDDRIVFLGNISDEDKQYYLRNCSALIFPTDYEAFGITALEASAYAKPILCSDIDIFNEILNHKGAIFFENTVGGISLVLEKFFNLSVQERISMGKINYDNSKNYSFEKSLQGYKKLFENLLG